MPIPQNVAETPTPASLKRRVAAIRERLPRDAKKQTLERFEDLNTPQGSRKVENVLNGGSSDQRITEFLESLVQPAEAAHATAA